MAYSLTRDRQPLGRKCVNVSRKAAASFRALRPTRATIMVTQVGLDVAESGGLGGYRRLLLFRLLRAGIAFAKFCGKSAELQI